LLFAGQWPSNLLDAAGIAGHDAERASDYFSRENRRRIGRSLLPLFSLLASFTHLSSFLKLNYHIYRNVAAHDTLTYANVIGIRDVETGWLTIFNRTHDSPYSAGSSSRESRFHDSTFHADCFCHTNERCTRRESLRSIFTAFQRGTIETVSGKVAQLISLETLIAGEADARRREPACLSRENYVSQRESIRAQGLARAIQGDESAPLVRGSVATRNRRAKIPDAANTR